LVDYYLDERPAKHFERLNDDVRRQILPAPVHANAAHSGAASSLYTRNRFLETMQRSEFAPNRDAAFRKASGSGLPRSTSAASD